VKLQGASLLDLVSELIIRLVAMERTALVGERLGTILSECGHEPIEVFERLLGPDKAIAAAAAAAHDVSPKDGSKTSRRT